MNQSLLCRHGYAGRCPKCITQNQPYQRQLGPAAATGGKEPTCRACGRTRAGHDAANALVAPSLRHFWDR